MRAKPRAACGMVTLLSLCPGVWAGDLTIRDFAPPETIFIVGADNTAAMMESFNRTGFRALWDEPSTQEWMKKSMADFVPALNESLEGIGLTKEDVTPPTGACGIATWWGPSKEAGGPPTDITLVMGDYGEGAQKMHDSITEALEKAANQKKLELSEKDHDGVTVWTVRIIRPEQEEAAEDWADMGEAGGVAGWMEKFGEEPGFYARSGDYLMLSTSEEALHGAIDRSKGDKRASIDENADFAQVRRQIGSTQGYAAFIVSSAVAFARKELEQNPEEASEIGRMLPILDVLGLNEVKAVGAGLKFDGEAGMMETPLVTLAPQKRGLLSLIDIGGPFEAPAFIGPDSASAMLFRFNFAGVLPLVNQVIATMPEEEAAEAQGMVGMLSMTAGPILANIGPEVHVSSQYERPFSADSSKTLFALAVKDSAAVTQSMAGLQGMLGLEARDFQGNQIWSTGAGMFEAPSIGLGFGRLFVGPTAVVENAMRQAGAAGGPSLSNEQRFKDSTRTLNARGMMFSWTDMKKAAEWYDWSSKNMETIVKAQIAEAFGPDEPADDDERQWRREAEENALKQIPAWMKEMPSGELIKKHVGDVVAEMRSTDAGLEGRVIWLRP